jgi:starch phosphorylase
VIVVFDEMGGFFFWIVFLGRYRPNILDPKLEVVVKSIQKGDFGDAYIFEPLIATLTIGNDFYIVSKDFASFLDTLDVIDQAFKDKVRFHFHFVLHTSLAN